MSDLIYRHKKRGTTYRVLADNAIRESDKQSLVVYQSTTDGAIWVRPRIEFYDGRFELVTRNKDSVIVALKDALREMTPPMPPPDASCHYGICSQEKCSNCRRIAAAHRALDFADGKMT